MHHVRMLLHVLKRLCFPSFAWACHEVRTIFFAIFFREWQEQQRLLGKGTFSIAVGSQRLIYGCFVKTADAQTKNGHNEPPNKAPMWLVVNTYRFYNVHAFCLCRARVATEELSFLLIIATLANYFCTSSFLIRNSFRGWNISRTERWPEFCSSVSMLIL